MATYNLDEILQLEKYYRISLINKISGLKSANLIATKSTSGVTNLAIFNSVIHIGSSPPMMGFIMRPLTVDRHTYTNIKENKYFTINQVAGPFHQQAHQTSAKFAEDVSEFQGCGLTEQYTDGFPVPFVAESKVQIGLSFKEENLIKANNTILMIGSVEKVMLPDEVISESGDVDLEALDAVCIGGLDTYYTCKRLGQYAYARVGEEVTKIG